MNFRTATVSALALAVALNAAPALAQDQAQDPVQIASADAAVQDDQAVQAAAQAGASEDVVVVTARKRDESAMDIPVTVSAIGGEFLETRGQFSLDSVARLTPSVIISDSGSVPQGGILAIRGFSGPENIILTDQSVSFNLDGVQVARATVRRMAQMDVEAVEVLRGPQALFYGKNSPAGVISIRSADPTADFRARISAGYEFEAQEFVTDGYISGPITETLGARLAFYGSTMDGWMTDTTPAGTIYSPSNPSAPERQEFALRGTLTFEPSARFDARLKLTYNQLETDGLTLGVQRIDCPSPAGPFGGVPAECTADDRFIHGNMGTVVGTIEPAYRDGVPYFTQEQFLAGLEMNYHLTDELTLTSQSGYYTVDLLGTGSLSLTPTNPATNFVTANGIDIEEISQEIRLTSDFSSWLNFLVGGFYQGTTASNLQRPFLGVITPTPIANAYLEYEGEAWSAFGQLLLEPIEGLEIGVGGRYSFEEKRATDTRAGVALTPITLNPTSDSWSNFSPEVTVTYRPSRQLTLYGSYRQGFLSGGFNTGAVTANGANALYDQQTVEGFEGGVKLSLLGGTLRADLAAYDYDISGLLVSRVLESGVTVAQNAGQVALSGVEFELNWRAPVDGLTVRAALSYNHARYVDFTTPCWRGQTQAQGCNFGVPNPTTGAFALQDLAGEQIARAPTWTGNLGASYETPLTTGLRLGLSGDVRFSSSYFTDTPNNPAGLMPSYQQVDAAIRLIDEGERWEVALVGTNLTDVYTYDRSYFATFGGGGTGLTVGNPTDTFALTSRGRQVLLRFTYNIR